MQQQLICDLENFLINHCSMNILIAGVSCSGKTTLSKEIQEHFTRYNIDVSIIHQDNYFKNLKDIPIENGWRIMDSPDAFHINEFRDDVQRFFREGYTTIPEYDIASNTRISKYNCVLRSEINIFEGLHTISILDGLDKSIKIFVDTDSEECLKRRIARDTRNLGVSRDRIETYWNSCIMPMSSKYVLPQKDDATIVISRG